MSDGNEVWSGVVLTPDEQARYDELRDREAREESEAAWRTHDHLAGSRRPSGLYRSELSIRYVDGRTEERAWSEWLSSQEATARYGPLPDIEEGAPWEK